jgi:hypothetical protein
MAEFYDAAGEESEELELRVKATAKALEACFRLSKSSDRNQTITQLQLRHHASETFAAYGSVSKRKMRCAEVDDCGNGSPNFFAAFDYECALSGISIQHCTRS